MQTKSDVGLDGRRERTTAAVYWRNGFVGQGQELALRGVVGEDLTGFDLVDPAMEVELALGQLGGDGREGPEIFDLDQDVFFHGGGEQGAVLEIRVVAADDA